MLKLRATQSLPTFRPSSVCTALVASDMAATDKLIHERMGSGVTLIPDLSRHLIDSGGKRLRPMLTLAAAQLGGYAGTGHVKLAAAVEFIHTATLLHDDVVDESALRRGKVSANIVWGNKPSVLVGDFLFSRAFQLMVETGSLTVLDILAGASAIIAEGEVMQLKSTNNLGVTEEDYLRVVECEDGSAVRGPPRNPVRSCPRTVAGTHRGHAGLWAEPRHRFPAYRRRARLFGPAGVDGQILVGDDFREARVTLPIILAYARSTEAARKFWQRAIETGPQGEADLDRAITLVEETGAISDTMARARRYADLAREALAPVPTGELRSVLGDIADFCVERAY